MLQVDLVRIDLVAIDLMRVDLVKGSPNKLVKIACATALTCLKLIYLLPSENSLFVVGVMGG